jgi:hypothetical protein
MLMASLTAEDLTFIDALLLKSNDLELLQKVAALRQLLDERRKSQNAELLESRLGEEESSDRATPDPLRYSRSSGSSKIDKLKNQSVPEDELLGFLFTDSPVQYEHQVNRKRRRIVKCASSFVDKKQQVSTMSPGLDEMKRLFDEIDSQELLFEEPVQQKSQIKKRHANNADKSQSKTKFAWPASKRAV